jgi:hypothetical protein
MQAQRKKIAAKEQSAYFNHFAADVSARTTVSVPEREQAKVTLAVVKKLQEALEPRIIRRTTFSKRPDGSAINPSLPEAVSILYKITLPADEMAILHRQEEKLENKKNIGTSFMEFGWTVRHCRSVLCKRSLTHAFVVVLDALSHPCRLPLPQRGQRPKVQEEHDHRRLARIQYAGGLQDGRWH